MGRIITRHDGARFHLGGRRVPRREHALKLSARHYGLNLQQWPATPARTNYGTAPAAQACLADILGNDQLGDCTEADQYHRQAIRQAAAGAAVFHPTLDQVVSTYSRDGGYVVGQPSTDQGCDETTVLGNHASQGIISAADGTVDRSAGFLLVDATNDALVRACCTMFVGANVCMGLPDAWVSPFPASPGWTWDVAGDSNPQNGHAFTLADQTDGDYYECWSWAMPFMLTKAALQRYATTDGGGGLYVEVDRDILVAASQQAPDALDWTQLLQDFQDAGGTAAP
jgi:hypothetical protein